MVGRLRAVLAPSVTLNACATSRSSAVVAPATPLGEPFVPSAPTGPAEPRTEVRLLDFQRHFESSLQQALSAALSEVVTAMAPICSPRCGEVTLVADPSLSWIAVTRTSTPRESSFILYKHGADEWSTLESEHDWLLYILAHEYGHHLDTAMSGKPRKDDWSAEIYADALAGCALASAGANEAKALELERDPDDGNDGSDAEHPPMRWSRRAVADGARACRSEHPTLDLVNRAAQDLVVQLRGCVEWGC